MNNNILKGFALIFFGILICIGGVEINRTLLSSFFDFPFSLAGVIIGIVGLAMVFSKKSNDTDK